jgi:hypothetical protein
MWIKDCTKVFHDLKLRLTQVPMLVPPRVEEEVSSLCGCF